MAGQLYGAPRHPPPLYRLARALRWASVLVLVALILFVGSVAYSAVSLARSSSNLGPVTTAFGGNSTVIISTTLTLNNPGFYPVSGLSIAVRIANASSLLLGQTGFGPVDLAGQATTSFPISLRVPVASVGAGESLLTQNQFLKVAVWANATYAYLFPVSLGINANRSWGAPFAHLMVGVTPGGIVNGTPAANVTLSFQNEASFADTGVLQFAVLSSTDMRCGGGGFALNVPPNQQYSQTQTVSLATGCDPSGGTLTSVFVTPNYTIVLPPESIP